MIGRSLESAIVSENRIKSKQLVKSEKTANHKEDGQLRPGRCSLQQEGLQLNQSEQQLGLGSPLEGLGKAPGAICSATNAAELHWKASRSQKGSEDWAHTNHSQNVFSTLQLLHGSALLRGSLWLASVQGKGAPYPEP